MGQKSSRGVHLKKKVDACKENFRFAKKNADQTKLGAKKISFPQGMTVSGTGLEVGTIGISRKFR
jgi:hypothetical protein